MATPLGGEYENNGWVDVKKREEGLYQASKLS